MVISLSPQSDDWLGNKKHTMMNFQFFFLFFLSSITTVYLRDLYLTYLLYMQFLFKSVNFPSKMLFLFSVSCHALWAFSRSSFFSIKQGSPGISVSVRRTLSSKKTPEALFFTVLIYLPFLFATLARLLLYENHKVQIQTDSNWYNWYLLIRYWYSNSGS